MDNLRKWFTIKQLVTGGPIVLLVVLSLALGVSRYFSEYENALNHALELSKTGAKPILVLMKPSVGGGNYANVQDESALALYSAKQDLLFFPWRVKLIKMASRMALSMIMAWIRFCAHPFRQIISLNWKAKSTR